MIWQSCHKIKEQFHLFLYSKSFFFKVTDCPKFLTCPWFCLLILVWKSVQENGENLYMWSMLAGNQSFSVWNKYAFIYIHNLSQIVRWVENRKADLLAALQGPQRAFQDSRANLNPTKPCQVDFEDWKGTGRELDRISASHCWFNL